MSYIHSLGALHEEPPVSWTEALLILSAASVALAVISAALVPVVIARLEADHSLRPLPPPSIGKNAAGAVLVVLGVVMLVTPGQGVLTILAGLSLLDFPGRRRLITRLLHRPAVQRATTAIRARRGAPPLLLPSAEDDP